MDVGVYIEQVCRDSDEIVSCCDVQIEAQPGMTMAVDRAISMALIVVELIVAFGVPNPRLQAKRRVDEVALCDDID